MAAVDVMWEGGPSIELYQYPMIVSQETPIF